MSAGYDDCNLRGEMSMFLSAARYFRDAASVGLACPPSPAADPAAAAGPPCATFRHQGW